MKCNIDGVLVRELNRHHDDRGWLAELFRQDELPVESHPVMSYLSMTRPGVARGPHEHRQQTDLFCFAGFSAFKVYFWDNRPDSPTHGHKDVLDVPEGKCVMVRVPPGVVHGYKNVGQADGYVVNAPDRLYAGEGRREPPDEIRHEDDPNSPFRIDD